MNIVLTPDIQAFFARCRHNLTHDSKNAFLGMTVTQANERAIQRQMKAGGFHEYQGPESTWPSLFISTKDFLNSPYHKAIRPETIANKAFRFTKETIRSNELFNVAAIQSDPNKELNDSMILRAMDEPYEATYLWQGEDVWMLDAPSEANTIDPIAQKAHGNVLTFGLGIGYFVYMASLNPKVTSITVIERSQSVIDLFTQSFLPQFPKTVEINILKGDAFDFFDEDYLSDYDFVFVDIWQSNDDGYPLIQGLLERYLPPFEKVDFWIESSCFEFMPALIFQHFEALAYGRKLRHHDPQMRKVLKKIKAYYDRLDLTIKDVDTLKTLMTDPKILRTIAAIRG